MTVGAFAGPFARPVAPPLPGARGPLSAGVLGLLRGAESPEEWDVPAALPYGEDLQLALYLAYELHYRGFAGVAQELEWDPALLGHRRELEDHFLGALQADVAGHGSDLDAVEAELVELVAQRAGNGIAAHLARHGDRGMLREILVHRSLYHLKEADPQAFVIPRLSGAAKAAVAAVEFDEYGGGVAARMHSALFAELMRDLDLDSRYGAYLDLVPAPMLAVVNFMSLSALHRRWRGALVGQLTAVEVTSPPGAALMARTVERVVGGEPDEGFYAEHVVADSVHERVMRDAVEALLTEEPDLAGDVVFGIRVAGLLDTRLDEHVLQAWAGGRTSLRRGLSPV